MKFASITGGLLTGTINGLLGAGGGMIAVPLLKKQTNTRTAHATSVCVILPLCIMSAISYLSDGRVSYSDAAPYILWGVIGSILGTFALRRLKLSIIRKIFTFLMLWAGLRLVFK